MPVIEPIPAFTDNYIWCLHNGAAAWVVDPGDAAPVIDFIETRRLHLEGILITHHHRDHTGGIGALREHFGVNAVCGPDNPAIAGITQPLRDGDTVAVLGETFAVLQVPGHTLDHLAYVSTRLQPPALFCGDTLFAGGCGRLFEGTPAQMFDSLSRIKTLAPATRVYCAHEYTQANLRFALAVEPDNLALRRRAQSADEARANEKPTLPSTLALELETNPFLRTAQPDVRAAARRQHPPAADEVGIFAALRRWKDQF